jgi:hypothetical protein
MGAHRHERTILELDPPQRAREIQSRGAAPTVMPRYLGERIDP